MVQLDPLKTILVISHDKNTFDNDKNLVIDQIIPNLNIDIHYIYVMMVLN